MSLLASATAGLKLPPSIYVEDVDGKTTRLEGALQKRAITEDVVMVEDEEIRHAWPATSLYHPPASPRLSINIQHKLIEGGCHFSPSCTIRPEVDAYVTPLSLCHQSVNEAVPSDNVRPNTPVPSADKVIVISGVSFGSAPPACLATSGSESSFTSVDIGGVSAYCVQHPGSHAFDEYQRRADMSWNSWNDSNNCGHTSSNTTCCFDIKMGIMTVSRAITGSGLSKCAHHQINMSDVMMSSIGSSPDLTQPSVSAPTIRKKTSMSFCSKIGIFFIALAILGIIAVGIAMYIEFVSKPYWAAQNKLSDFNGTAICDLLVDSCDRNGTLPVSTKNNTVDPKIANETGRIEAHFSTNFINQLSSLAVNQTKREANQSN